MSKLNPGLRRKARVDSMKTGTPPQYGSPREAVCTLCSRTAPQSTVRAPPWYSYGRSDLQAARSKLIMHFWATTKSYSLHEMQDACPGIARFSWWTASTLRGETKARFVWR
ncbi:hypothetical protein AAFF_G00099770 [Aldrovandia affinis]|uniref:Uncharacterized protein n=1 Tax=Aldrovandia affinis TaxID=143900 RepID=A0AAD7RV73_9TELE|nr:hypothetical protein AAFF_G00099770 [Aldrovandia affinis]